MSRKSLVAAALLLIAAQILGGCGSQGSGASKQAPAAQSTPTPAPAPKLEPRKVRFAQPVVSFSFAAVYAADALGYLKDEAITLETITAQGGTTDVAMLYAKEADFVGTGGEQLITSYAEKPLIGVATLTGRQLQSLVMRKDTAERLKITDKTPFADRLKALKGLKIGITRPGSTTDVLARWYIKRAGLEPGKDVDLVNTGTGTQPFAALEKKLVDIIIYTPPTTNEMVRRGLAVFFINNVAGDDPELSSYLQQVMVTLPDTVKKDPELVKRFLRAVVRANDWMLEQKPDAVAKLLKPHFPSMQEETLLDSITAYQSAYVKGARFDAKGVETVITIAELARPLAKKPQWTDVVTNDFLPR